MDRQKYDGEVENYLWANPCSYNDSSKATYMPKHARFVAQQAKITYKLAVQYKDEFTKLHSFDTFDNLLKQWNENWLRSFSWYREEVLPQKKVLFQPIPTEDLTTLMTHIDEVLPPMYKALKMVTASLNSLGTSLEHDGICTDEALAVHVKQTVKDVRAVLCYFYDLMKARNLDIMPVYDSEIPEINNDNKLEIGLIIYRDTLNYLEYIAQVFQTMAETKDVA